MPTETPVGPGIFAGPYHHMQAEPPGVAPVFDRRLEFGHFQIGGDGRAKGPLHSSLGQRPGFHLKKISGLKALRNMASEK